MLTFQLEDASEPTFLNWPSCLLHDLLPICRLYVHLDTVANSPVALTDLVANLTVASQSSVFLFTPIPAAHRSATTLECHNLVKADQSLSLLPS